MEYKSQPRLALEELLKAQSYIDVGKLEDELNHQEEIAERLNMNIESDRLMDHLKYLDPVYDKIVDLKSWIRILKQCR